jgi:hypothetical protein
MPEKAPLELEAEKPVMSLFELAEYRQKKQEALQGKDIEVRPDGQAGSGVMGRRLRAGMRFQFWICAVAASAA